MASAMEEVFDYLKSCGTFYLATLDKDQPRVRPFGAIAVFEGRLYIQTGNIKAVFRQMKENSKIEISGMVSPSSWIRVAAEAVQDDRIEARQHMLDANPSLKRMYAADGNCEVLYLKNAVCTFYEFGDAPRTVTF